MIYADYENVEVPPEEELLEDELLDTEEPEECEEEELDEAHRFRANL